MHYEAEMLKDPILIRNIAGNVNVLLWCEGQSRTDLRYIEPITLNDTSVPSSPRYSFLTEERRDKLKILWDIAAEVTRMGNIKLR